VPAPPNNSFIDTAQIDTQTILFSDSNIDGAIIDTNETDQVIFNALIDACTIDNVLIDAYKLYPFSSSIDNAIINISAIERVFTVYDLDVDLLKLGIVSPFNIDAILASATVGWLLTPSVWGRRVSHTILPVPACPDSSYPVCIKVYKGVGTNGTEVWDGETVGKIYCQNTCNNDFTDLRFTLWNGTSLLKFYKLTYVSGNYAIFFVNIPYYLSTSSVKIYVYYDNPTQTTDTSDFVGTFYEGDRFDRADSYDLGTTEIGLRTWQKYRGTFLRLLLDTQAQIQTQQLLMQADNLFATKYDSWYTNVFLPSISIKYDIWHLCKVLYSNQTTEYDQWEPQQWFRDVIATAVIDASFIEYYFAIDWATIDSPQIDYQALVGAEDGDSPYSALIATRREVLTFNAGGYVSALDTDLGLTLRLSTDTTVDIGALVMYDNDAMVWIVDVWDSNLIPAGSIITIQGGTGAGTSSIDSTYQNGKSAGSSGSQIQIAKIQTVVAGGGADYSKIDTDTVDRDRNADMFVSTGHSTAIQSDSRIDSGVVDSGYVPC
jgi:hypothetical protein